MVLNLMSYKIFHSFHCWPTLYEITIVKALSVVTVKMFTVVMAEKSSLFGINNKAEIDLLVHLN